jgi:acetyl esterase/lipase
VPFGYLIPVLIIGFCTWVAVIGPRPPHTTPSHWSYWVTFEVNEQPFISFYLLAVLTLVTAVSGDLGSPGGLAALGLAVLTAAGQAILVRQALATGPAVQRALAEGGIAWQPGPRPWGRVLFPWIGARPRGVVRVGDVAYGEAGRRNLLDVYHRRDRPAGAPVFVYFHGGGFRGGHKRRGAGALLNHLALQGWVGISANYRLAPEAGYPEHHIDAKRVIAWVRAHAAGYGADPRTVVVAGTSAGGHLATTLALTQNDPAFQPGFEDADTSVAAAVGFSGYYGRVAGPGSSPLEHLGDAPPFLFVHGTSDSSTLVEDAREFAARLREVSTRPVLLAELPGGQHAYDLFFSLRYSYVIEGVTAFCRTLRAEHRQ